MNKRAVILGTAIIFGFVLVVVRLTDLMLLDHKSLSAKASSQYSSKKNLHLSRGGIFDRRGRELAVNVDVFSAYCNPRKVESPQRTARALAKVTGKSYRTILKRISSDKGFVWIKRKLDHDEISELKALGLKGVGYLPEVKRFYPNGPLASHVVGFVGVDNQPLEGIELKYDEQLRGWDESVQILKDARGRTLSDGRDFRQGGNSLVLTIDTGLQYILETELEKAYRQWDALSASAIMMNPHTGEILAMSNRPTYDLNRSSSYKASDRRNRAITDSYEPGSTFKVITAAAVLEEGLVTPSTSFDCSKGYVKVANKAIWDTHNMGVLTFREVIRSSSNVGTVMAAMGLQNEEFSEYMKKFGFGSKTGIDLHGEAPGKVRPVSEWSGTALASASIGYGVAVTPLQILKAYSAVANGGVLPVPYIVSEIISPRGETLYRFHHSEQKRAISTRTAQTLKDILISVTQEGGTATQAVVDGNRVAGKTGTARLLDKDTGEYSTEKYSSSFVGFAPADNPKIALVVLLYEPKGKYYGGQVAAPVFRDIVDKSLSYMKVPREDNFDNNVLLVHARRL